MAIEWNASAFGLLTIATEIVSSDRCQAPSVVITQTNKSANVVPRVVEAMIVAQYSEGWNFVAAICQTTSATSTREKARCRRDSPN
jgi:hypothetical protein